MPVKINTTADSKAHAEIGLTTAGGHKGCRRCYVSGQYIPEKRHYYYGRFRQRYMLTVPMRSVDSNRQYGKAADSASTTAERQRIIWENGVTGETIFYRLYDLDPIFDMVVDVMHALLLNLVLQSLKITC